MVEQCYYLVMQDIPVPNTAFFSKIKQSMVELYSYSLTHYTQTHLTVDSKITLQN